MSQTVFTSVETGRWILVQLYTAARKGLFEINLIARRSGEDHVEEVKIPILVERDGNKRPSYKHPNGKVVIEATAYIKGVDEIFTITISPEIDSASITGAEVIVPEPLGDLIHKAAKAL